MCVSVASQILVTGIWTRTGQTELIILYDQRLSDTEHTPFGDVLQGYSFNCDSRNGEVCKSASVEKGIRQSSSSEARQVSQQIEFSCVKIFTWIKH